MSSVLAALFLFSLPGQLGRHFWLPESYLWGLPIDYLAPTLYLNSLFLLAWFLWEWHRRRPQLRFLAIWLTAAAINIFFAQNRRLAFFSWLWLSQLPMVAWLIGRSRHRLKRILPSAIFFWLILETVFAAGQLWRQASLAPWGWWFGERSFSISTPGIAKVSLAGQFWLRPYGTFSHPNALAGFILAALLLALGLKLSRRQKLSLCLLGAFLISATASHTIILLAILVIFLCLPKPWRWLSLGFIPLLGWLPINPQSWQRRWQLAQAAIGMVRRYPLVGTGLGNFLPQLPHFWPADQIGQLWIQPAHNIYLLWLSQTGLWGLAAIYFLRRYWPRPQNRFLALSLAVIALSGLLDHYWLTGQQNLLLLGVILGQARAPDPNRRDGRDGSAKPASGKAKSPPTNSGG